MSLTERDIAELTAWRRGLHARPEISGAEEATAGAARQFLTPTEPDHVFSGLGGHGVAFVYDGLEPGPTVMFRAELDALPIHEIGSLPHRSQDEGKAHLCGHDGHMAILAGLGRVIARQRPKRGRIVLMFQPAEETGQGAAAVIADPRFGAIAPDYAFSLHNLPGIPLGHVSLRAGPANCASRGMRVVLQGKTAHASMPETGVSPMRALSALMPRLTALGRSGALDEDFSLVTVTHAAMGAAAFGIAPGAAELWATLRTLVDSRMEALCMKAEALVREAAASDGLTVEIGYHDVFRHCENDAEATALLRGAVEAEALTCSETGSPIRASEDFGRFGDGARAAMLFLGAGETHPALHNPDYDFPDELIPVGAGIFERTARAMLG